MISNPKACLRGEITRPIRDYKELNSDREWRRGWMAKHGGALVLASLRPTETVDGDFPGNANPSLGETV